MKSPLSNWATNNGGMPTFPELLLVSRPKRKWEAPTLALLFQQDVYTGKSAIGENYCSGNSSPYNTAVCAGGAFSKHVTSHVGKCEDYLAGNYSAGKCES